MKLLCQVFVAALAPLLVVACEQSPPDERPGPVREPAAVATPVDNPLLSRYLTPFRVPPFHKLEAGHFLPALEQAISTQADAIEAITSHSEDPDFTNTIIALETSGNDLVRIARTFFGLLAVSPDPQLHDIAGQFSARLASHNDQLLFNRELYERIRAVDEYAGNSLSARQHRHLEQTQARFYRAGADLSNDEHQRLEQINSTLAELAQSFDIALREASHRHELLIDDPAAIEDLPDTLANLAARSARDRGHGHAWAFTLHAHSFYPFMRHFPDRDMRRQHYQAWAGRIDPGHGQQHNAGEIVQRMASLRAERAALLGYESHTDYLLSDSTIGNREQLRNLLNEVAQAARRTLEPELDQLRELARADGISEPLQPWDWWYYAQRLRQRQLALGDNELRVWFPLDQVRDGAFALANRLWGLSFHLHKDIPVWHSDVATYEVRDAMGEHLGVIYLDYRHREGKHGGAWTSNYRPQQYVDGERIAPVVANVANFPPAATGLHSLLNAEEVQTLFHEFGHALHELFSDVPFRSLAGSAVPADFIEFPAQLLEHWALQPEVLRMYAYHHETGSMIDDDAVEALQHDQHLLAGLETLQFIAAIELDLALHDVAADAVPTLEQAEQAVAERLDLPPMLSPRNHGQGLSSLFSVRRRGGDYRTLWSEMLAADAFAAFIDDTIIDRELANRLREEIFSQGNARDPMASWQAFRGRPPEIRHLLHSRGLMER